MYVECTRVKLNIKFPKHFKIHFLDNFFKYEAQNISHSTSNVLLYINWDVS